MVTIKALGQIDLGAGIVAPGGHVEVSAAVAAELVELGVAEIIDGAPAPAKAPVVKPKPKPKPKAPAVKPKPKAPPEAPKAPPEAPKAPPEAPEASPAGEGGDDLTRVSGIGPAAARQLADAGVRTLADLATMSDEEAGQLPGGLAKRVLESHRAAAAELLDGNS